jgi:hypothetical protein
MISLKITTVGFRVSVNEVYDIFPTSLLFSQADRDNLLVYCDRYYPRRGKDDQKQMYLCPCSHNHCHPTCQRCSSACRDVDVTRVKKTFGFDEALYPRGGLR